MKKCLIILAIVIATTAIGCQSVDRVLNPTDLRTDYKNLKDLTAIIDFTSDELLKSMRREYFDDAYKHSENLQVYATDLKAMIPENRSTDDIERFDNFADHLHNLAVTTQYYARKHMGQEGANQARKIRENVAILNTYNGGLRPDEGTHHEQRIIFRPEDRIRAAGGEIDMDN